jgi:hypothetical protein
VKKLKTKYVGTTEAIGFIRKHHGMFRLPADEVFALVENPGTDDEVYILISEADRCLELTGCRYVEDLGLTTQHFDALVAKVVKEARACHIAPPYSVTFANCCGVFSYPQRAVSKRKVA